jgi:ribosomal protein S18 acetylase RimI-like enzyme
MASPSIKAATSSDEASVIDAIVLAFSTDPFARWIWPDPHEYLTHFAAFTRGYGEKAFTHESAYYVDGYLGAALWLPPDVHPNEDPVMVLLQDTVDADKQEDLFGLLERMDSCVPEDPYRYLPFIGVDSMHQGKGLGSALLERGLLRCDHDKTPAFLESTNPANISLYERHGFEILDAFQIGSSPLVSVMKREPR